jgi:N-acylglucosamine-6-phosphate 2-epimerase
MTSVSKSLPRGLIVSVQAYADSVLDTPETIALLARCAVANGAVGVRIEGRAKIAAVRAAVDVPIIGIIKRTHPGVEPYITSTLEEVDEVADAGADIVAFDATRRPHAGATTVGGLVARVHEHGLLAMADGADLEDLAGAAQSGADIVATTLAGYTAGTRGRSLPALDLVRAAVRFHDFVICEGGIVTPQLATDAFAAGATAIVVGTAITNVDALVRAFVAASVITGNDPRAV